MDLFNPTTFYMMERVQNDIFLIFSVIVKLKQLMSINASCINIF